MKRWQWTVLLMVLVVVTVVAQTDAATEDEELQWLLSLPALIVTGLLGMLTHFMKKQVRGETLTDIRNFFRDHFKSTFIAVTVTVVSVVGYYVTLATGQFADVVLVFLLGFGFDSTLNTWEQRAAQGNVKGVHTP